MIAVKFQSQNLNNKGKLPGYWIWKQIDNISEDETNIYSSVGWSIYSEEDLEVYKKDKKITLETFLIGKIPDQFKYLDVSVASKVEFANGLISDFKKKNISDGINAVQGLWMHQRVRALPVTLSGMTFTIDLMNMVISGDLELACLSLIYTPADNMTLPYHWLSRARLDFLIGKLKIYLGWS